jgi:hypothetical protein
MYTIKSLPAALATACLFSALAVSSARAESLDELRALSDGSPYQNEGSTAGPQGRRAYVGAELTSTHWLDGQLAITDGATELSHEKGPEGPRANRIYSPSDGFFERQRMLSDGSID